MDKKVASMSGHSPMISMRIPEDHLLELDQLVGLDGMRNRSDVIRTAIRKYLSDEHRISGNKVEVNLGPDLSSRMEDFCKLHGEKPDSVLRQAAREHIRNVTLGDAKVTDLIYSRMNELRERINDDSNAI